MTYNITIILQVIDLGPTKICADCQRVASTANGIIVHYLTPLLRQFYGIKMTYLESRIPKYLHIFLIEIKLRTVNYADVCHHRKCSFAIN